MRQVSQASNVSTGTINYHFQNKQNLIIAALEAAYRLPHDWEEYKGSPAAQLRRIMLSYVLRANSDRWWRFWINYLAYSTRDETMQEHQSVRYDSQLRFWSRLIADGIAKGELRDDLEPLETARQLLITTHGLVTLQLMKPDAATRAYARDHINALVSSWWSRGRLSVDLDGMPAPPCRRRWISEPRRSLRFRRECRWAARWRRRRCGHACPCRTLPRTGPSSR